MLFIEVGADTRQAFTCIVPFEYLTDNFGFFLDDEDDVLFLGFGIEFTLVSVDIAGECHITFCECVADSPNYVLAEGFGFCLCEVTHDGYHSFACFGEGIDFFLLEDNRDSEGFQFSDVFEAVYRISCES